MINCRAASPGQGPALKLDNLKRLERLALKSIVPAELQVWEDCRVYVEGPAIVSISDGSWSRVTGNISYLRYVAKASEMLDLSASFTGFKNLHIVYLHLRGLGKDGTNVPLDGLANVKRLCILANDLFITVPAKVQWEEVWFGGFKALGVTFVDVDAFISSCDGFAVCYKSLIGAWLPLLCKSLAARGLDYFARDRDMGNFVNSVLSRGKVNFNRCFCGACLKCLAPFHGAVSEWAT